MACSGCAAGVGCQTKTGGTCAAPSPGIRSPYGSPGFAGTIDTRLLGDIGPSTGRRNAPRTGCKTCGGRKTPASLKAPLRGDARWGLRGLTPYTGAIVVGQARRRSAALCRPAECPIWAGPDFRSGTVQKITRGQRILLTGATQGNGGWTEVAYLNGTTAGWIPTAYLEPVVAGLRRIPTTPATSGPRSGEKRGASPSTGQMGPLGPTGPTGPASPPADSAAADKAIRGGQDFLIVLNLLDQLSARLRAEGRSTIPADVVAAYVRAGKAGSAGPDAERSLIKLIQGSKPYEAIRQRYD